MIIFFGIRTKVIAGEICLDDFCPGCKSENFYLTFTQSYIHIFWIPFIPLNKRPVFYCRSCGKSFKIRTLPPKFKKAIQAQKSMAKTPSYYFSGIAIAALIILVLLIS